MRKPTVPCHIVLTGATGFLGHYLAAELSQRTNVQCRLLLRPPLETSRARLVKLLAELGLQLDVLIKDHRVTLFEGSLPDRIDAAPMRGADTLLHAAGNISFDRNASGEPEKTNVEGTRALLSVASDAGINHVVLISTAYACGDVRGRISERIGSTSGAFNNDYERSKWQAEQLALEWAGDRRTTTICRPSILFGDRSNGRATAFKGVYLVARATDILSRAVSEDPAFDRHQIPLRILGHPDATCNLVPVDWAARRMVDITLDPRLHGHLHHITNPQPPTHAEIKSWLEAYFDIGGGVFSDTSGPLNDPNHYEALFYSLGNIVSDYFRYGLSFESRFADRHQNDRRLIDRADFLRALAYAHTRNWGRSRFDATPPAGDEGAPNHRWYFEEFLPRTVPKSRVARIHSLTTVVRFCIGSSGEEWVCRFDRGRLAETHHGPNSLTAEFGFRVSGSAFDRLIAGEQPLQAAFFAGDADVRGNMERALRMVPIMSAFIQEFPARHE